MILVPIKNIVFRIGWIFFLFLLYRFFFQVLYSDVLGEIGLWEYWIGLLFDLSSFTHLFGLYVFLELLCFWIKSDLLNKATLYVYVLGIIVLVALNSIDLVYFSFTSRRTTSDVLSFVVMGNDLFRLLPAFFLDFWYSLIPVFGLIWTSYKLYLIPFSGIRVKKVVLLAVTLLTIPLMVVMSRGGLQLKPISVISASKFVDAQNTALVLNTPFTFVTTLLGPTVYIPEYFTTLTESEKIYSPVNQSKALVPNGKNVVLVIVESLAKEFIGGYGNKPSYTPFIDSLMDYSTVFNYAFANGKRSIEALPAIVSGLPTLMQTPIIYSPFAANRLSGIPSTLNKYNYNSSFYHGGHNGTMGFEEYCMNVGFDKYVGMEEFPGQNLYDGSWGIFDEPFLQYMANDLDDSEKPFFASVFTLSSHHPYTIPVKHKGKFPKGTLQLHETIGYVDYAIYRFFETAKTKEWYDNTVFIITADHTAQLEKDKSKVGEYSIPMIVFDPSKPGKQRIDNVVQQNDIYPTVIRLLGVSDDVICYGRDMFDENEGMAISYSGGVFQVINNKYAYGFNGELSIYLYDYKTDTSLSKNLIGKEGTDSLEIQTKAIIDSYVKRMNSNKLFF